MQTAALTKVTAQSLIDQLPKGFRKGQRMVEYLAEHPNAASGDVIQNCVIGNLSDVAYKLNSHLHKAGYAVGCAKSPSISRGKGQQFAWSVFQLPEAANDPKH